MGSNLVIVALPADDDPTWKVSSEKKPHMTLLFLGPTEGNDNVDRIVEFVQHAITVSEHGPFYMDVDHRGTLGSDEADVLFFRKGWSAKWITEFRNQLLQNTDIKTAYDSTEQFPEWHPHLTLGYPAAPADDEKIPEYGLNGIRFDRIAVWLGDFEGPEMRLEWPEYDNMAEVGWSAMSGRQKQYAYASDSLEHHGVKGMKWGVRKVKDTEVTVGGQKKMVTAKKAEKLDQKFQKNASTASTWIDLHNKAADGVNHELPAFNQRFEDKYGKEKMDSGVLWNHSDPLTKEYHTAYNDMFVKHLNNAAASLGTSPTGKYKVSIQSENHESIHEFGWAPSAEKVKHAATDNTDLVFVAKMDEEGRIISVTPKATELSQTAEMGSEFIEHYGVKGMRWGVRSDRTAEAVSKGAASAKSGAKTVARGAAKTGRAVGKGVGKAATAAADISFENQALDGRALNKVGTHAAKEFRKSVAPQINAKPEYADARKTTHRLTHPRDEQVKKYRKEVKTAYVNQLEKSANSFTNASGTREWTIRPRGDDLPGQGGALPSNTFSVYVTTRPRLSAQHAASTEQVLRADMQMDKDGFVIDVGPLIHVTDTVSHGADFVEELVHYGVKGMRWGVRKDPPSAVAPVATSRVPHGDKRKTKIKAEGGQNHPAHEDAIKVAEAKAKLVKSGPAALSNQELREVANRVQLESQVKQLVMPKGQRFVKRLLGQQGNQAANQFVSSQVKKKVSFA